MSKICKNCGNPIPDEAVICTNCGAAVEQPQQTGGGTQKLTDMGNTFVEKLKTDRKVLGISIGVAVLAIAAVVVLWVIVGPGGYNKAVKSYIDFSILGKTELAEELMPKSVWDYLEDEEILDMGDFIDAYDEQYEEYVLPALEEEFGENIRVKYKVTDEDELSERKMEDLRDYLKDQYDVSRRDVKKAYEVEIEATVIGDKDEDTDSMDCVVVNIAGKWYVLSEDYSFLVY